MPELLSTSVIKQVEESKKNIKKNQENRDAIIQRNKYDDNGVIKYKD